MDTLTPYAGSLGITVIGEDGGMPLLTLPYSSDVEGRPGVFHGGGTAGLLEAAGYAALRTALNTGDAPHPQLKPINITMQYLAAARSEPNFAVARIARLGSRIANVTVEAWQSDRERRVATAVMNVQIVRPAAA